MSVNTSRVFTDAEGELIAQTGIYGCWLLKHGKTIGGMKEAERILMAYADYIKHPPQRGIAFLMDAVDKFIKEVSWEPLGAMYDDALRDLINFRKQEPPHER